MSNQIQAIRSEIERRIEKYNEYLDKVNSERAAWKWAECKSLLSFIDSLPQEPMEILADKCKMDETPAPDNWEPVDVGDLIMEPQEPSEDDAIPCTLDDLNSKLYDIAVERGLSSEDSLKVIILKNKDNENSI